MILQTISVQVDICDWILINVISRYIVLPKDFEKGYKNNIKKDEAEHEFYK